MHILLVTCTLKPMSGWGTYSLNTAKGLRSKGHTVTVLTAEASGQDMHEEVVLPEPLSMVSSPLSWIRATFALRSAIRTHRPDVVHILVEPYAIAMPLLAFITRVPPWVMNLHGTYSVLPFTRFASRCLFSSAFRKCAGFLVCSTFTYERTRKAISRYGSSDTLVHLERKMRFFRFGIEPSEFRHVRTSVTAEKCIVYIGGIKERKGLQEMILGCAAFCKRSTLPVRIVLAGYYHPDDAYVRDLRTVIRQSGMEDIVSFEGQVSEERREELYAAADVFMMLSKSDDVYFEGFGLVFLEANQRGLPVIGSVDSGCKEAIDEGKSGYAVDAFNPREVADALHRILEKGDISPENCMAWAAKHNMNQQDASCETLYRDVLTVRPVS